MTIEEKLEAPRAIAAELRRLADESFSVEAEQANEAAAAIDELIEMVERKPKVAFCDNGFSCLKDILKFIDYLAGFSGFFPDDDSEYVVLSNPDTRMYSVHSRRKDDLAYEDTECLASEFKNYDMALMAARGHEVLSLLSVEVRGMINHISELERRQDKTTAIKWRMREALIKIACATGYARGETLHSIDVTHQDVCDSLCEHVAEIIRKHILALSGNDDTVERD